MTEESGSRKPFEADFTKLFSTIPAMPNIAALMAAHQKNIEALTDAYKVTLQGGQAIARRHVEIMQQAMSDLGETVQSMAGPTPPQAKAAMQTELIKKAYERAMANMKELGETIQQVNTDAVGVLNKRFVEAVDEVKALAATTKPD